MQETFLKAYEKYSFFRGKSDVKTWLTRIAINTCKDMQRQAGRKNHFLTAETPDGEDLHIVFSEEYQDCYIDSYGFVDDSIYENPENLLHIFPKRKKLFTMTVVCDDASKDTIRNLVFQNVNTGLNGAAELDVKELEDGRLRFYYSVNYDGSYMNETYPVKGGTPRDTTMEDLRQLVLKLYEGRKTETLMTGTLEEKIRLEDNRTEE